MRGARLQERRAPLLLCQNRRGEGSSTLSLSRRGDNGERGEKTAALIARNKVSLITTQRGLENTGNVGKSRCFVAHRCERLGLICCLPLNKLTPTPIHHSGFVQEVVFSATGGFDHCWPMTGKYDKGEKKRKRGWRRKGGRLDGMSYKKEAGMWEGVDAGDGGRVSECWWCWVMKYSVRVCLWLLPSLFFSLSDITG